MMNMDRGNTTAILDSLGPDGEFAGRKKSKVGYKSTHET